MPQTPKVIEMSEALKILVDLYKECEWWQTNKILNTKQPWHTDTNY
jgi:hypothetical protein